MEGRDLGAWLERSSRWPSDPPAAALYEVEWGAREHIDEWVTSNRYIGSARHAQGGMAVTVVLVALVALFTFSLVPPGRRDTGRSLDDRPWAFLTTVVVLGLLLVAWLVTVLS